MRRCPESPAASPAADADTDTDPPECSTRTPICSGGECKLDVALTPRAIVGELTYDGAAVTGTYWELSFVETTNGLAYTDSPVSGSTPSSYVADVPDGTYDVVATGWSYDTFLDGWPVTDG